MGLVLLQLALQSMQLHLMEEALVNWSKLRREMKKMIRQLLQ